MLKRILAVMGACAVLALPAAAQTYPDRPIRMLVGYPAGGPTDNAARIVAESMAGALGQPVVIENMPGAVSAIAVRAMLAAPADGYTIIMATTGFPVAEARNAKPEYLHARDFDFIGPVTKYPNLLMVNAKSDYVDLPAFLAKGEAASEPLNVAAMSHSGELLIAYIAQSTGADLEHIPYHGQAAVATDLLAGRLDAAILSPAVSQAFIESGELRALGASTSERFSLMPDVPTFSELGLNLFEAAVWNGLLAKSGTDPAIIARLNAALNAALNDPAVADRLRKTGLDPFILSPEEFRASVLEEIEVWKGVVAAGNIPLIE